MLAVSDLRPGFFVRIGMAFAAFFRVLFSGDYAARLRQLQASNLAPSLGGDEVAGSEAQSAAAEQPAVQQSMAVVEQPAVQQPVAVVEQPAVQQPVAVVEQPDTALPQSPSVKEPAEAEPAPAALVSHSPAAALQLLGLLQQEGRLVDFLYEDIGPFSDADVGAAARVVHAGCKKALTTHVELLPVYTEEEGSRLTVPEGFSPAEVRLTGNVVGQAPFTGTLQHRGWRVAQVNLPQVHSAHALDVIAPAEVEL